MGTSPNVSATSPYVVARGDGVLIADDLNHPSSDRIYIAARDLDEVIADLAKIRDERRTQC